jgi:hypothetical protein
MAAARKACVSNGRPPLIAPAIDLIEGRSLSLAEGFAVVTKSGEKKDGGEERAGLTKSVELMIGMPVMVTTNIQTELDVANGSRGEIVGIVLHPSEKDWKEEDCIRNLTQQPPYILVKLLRTKIQQLSDLPCRKNRKNHIWYDSVMKDHIRHDKVVRWRVTLSVTVNVYILNRLHQVYRLYP